MPVKPMFSGPKYKYGWPAVAVALVWALGSVSVFGQLTGTTMPAAPLTPAAAPASPEPTLTLPPVVPPTAGGDTRSGPLLTLPPVATTAPGHLLMPTPSTPAATTAPAAAFLGEVSHDHVYVRSGPGVNFYELGQLSKGDVVEVVGTKNGWYLIDPPVGTICYVAKDLVDLDAGGQTGTIKGEFVNIRAASLIHPVSDYVVLTRAKKGTKVTIEGSEDKYYKISPPEGVHVYISAQLVATAPAGTEYATPTLKLPTNFSPMATTAAATQPGVAATGPATQAEVIVVTPQPVLTLNSAARTKFAEVNDRTQAEFVKPILQEDLQGLIADYKAILAMADVSPSVTQSCQERITLVQKRLELQNIAKEAAAPEPAASVAEQKALEQTWEQSEKQIADAELNGPYVAEGELRTSEALQSKYVLVNPMTKRVVAYVDPANSDVDVSPLLGHYIGVKGKIEMADGIKLVHVRTATLMKAAE